MKKLRLSARKIVVFIVLVLLVVFIAGTETYLASVKNGLNLYVVAVLPSMLPFFFFSKLLTELDFASDAGKLLAKPLCFFYRSPPVAGYMLIMSMLCGYPVGAKLIGEFFASGLIDEKQAKKISAFTSTSGPLFIVGTVGISMFGDKISGYVLLFSHYLGTLINGFFYRGKKSDAVSVFAPELKRTEDVLNKVMLNTFLSVGIVGGYITIFNLLLDVTENMGLIPLLAKILTEIGVDARITSGVAGGLIEMTKGCLMLSKSGFPILITLPLACFLISFGGMSVTFQSLTFLSNAKISPAYYLLTKLTQGIVSSIICLSICLIF